MDLSFSDPTHPPLCWRDTWMVPYNKSTVEILQNFVAFSEYMNFKNSKNKLY